MASISGKETKPEIQVRKYLFCQGFRFRKNVKALPGKPDVVLAKYRTVIFIHGCFWHGHDCKKAAKPTSNVSFWSEKIKSNIDRDKRHTEELVKSGWNVIVIWECELKNKESFANRMEKVTAELLQSSPIE
jgi:DNA mismatch endonuclease (patch repair protein)